MKKMVVQKQEAQGLVEFLAKVELKNRLSRLCTRLMKQLRAVAAEMEEERFALYEQYAAKNEKGEIIVRDDKINILDARAFHEALKELQEEEVAIETGEYSSNFAPLFAYLDSEDFDMPLQGADADCYDRLLTLWEEAQEGNEEE